MCCAKLLWDTQLNGPLKDHWTTWEKSLPLAETVPGSVVDHREEVHSVELHTFGDASTQGVGAAVYSLI